MCISRRLQIKKDMKLLIVNTILDVFKDENIAYVSLRSIANKINYSPATIYLYFKNKNEILSAVSQRGYWMLMSRMKSKMERTENTLEKLYLHGEAYLDFALENPQIYELMFIEKVSDSQVDFLSGKNYKEDYHYFIKHVVRECFQQNIIEFSQTETIVSNWHSFLHGYTSLRIRNRICYAKNTIQNENSDRQMVSSFFEVLKQTYFQNALILNG